MAERPTDAAVPTVIPWERYNPDTIYVTAGDYRIWLDEYEHYVDAEPEWEVTVFTAANSHLVMEQRYKTKQAALEAAEVCYWRCLLDAW